MSVRVWALCGAASLTARRSAEIHVEPFHGYGVMLSCTHINIIHTSMNAIISTSEVKTLAASDAITRVEAVGERGGWTVQIETIASQVRILASREKSARRFRTFEAVMRLLRQLGLRPRVLDNVRVVGGGWSDETTSSRRRPDRSAQMRVKAEDLAYLTYLRDAAQRGKDDPTRYTSQQVDEEEDALFGVVR